MKLRLLILITSLTVLGLAVGCFYPVYEPGPRHQRMYDPGPEREHMHGHHP